MIETAKAVFLAYTKFVWGGLRETPVAGGTGMLSVAAMTTTTDPNPQPEEHGLKICNRSANVYRAK